MLVPFLPMYLIDELGVAQSDVNIWSGLIFSISFLISAIMAPIWGALSDKKSHKAMAVRAAVCLAISYVWGGTLFADSQLMHLNTAPVIEWKMLFKLSTFIYALLFCLLLNLLSSGWPAWRASRMSIINALGGKLN